MREATIIPKGSEAQYHKTYEGYLAWKMEKGTDSGDEAVLLNYSESLKKRYAGWTKFSHINWMLFVKTSIQLKKYAALKIYKARVNDGYAPNKAQIRTRLMKAPGSIHFSNRSQVAQEQDGVVDSGDKITVSLNEAKNKRSRRFYITNSPSEFGVRISSMQKTRNGTLMVTYREPSSCAGKSFFEKIKSSVEECIYCNRKLETVIVDGIEPGCDEKLVESALANAPCLENPIPIRCVKMAQSCPISVSELSVLGGLCKGRVQKF